MSEIKLFHLNDGTASEIPGSASGLEKPLQTLFEHNLETLLGVRFLASEYVTDTVAGNGHTTCPQTRPQPRIRA